MQGFGVKADIDNTTEVHVFKGETTIIAGNSKDKKEVVDVIAGQARLVTHNKNSSVIENITLKKSYFIRKIDTPRPLKRITRR